MRPSLSALPSPVQYRLPESRKLPGESRDARRELPAACKANEQNAHRSACKPPKDVGMVLPARRLNCAEDGTPMPSSTARNNRLLVRTRAYLASTGQIRRIEGGGHAPPFRNPPGPPLCQASAVPNTAAAERRDGAWCVGSRRGSPKALAISPFPEEKPPTASSWSAPVSHRSSFATMFSM